MLVLGLLTGPALPINRHLSLTGTARLVFRLYLPFTFQSTINHSGTILALSFRVRLFMYSSLRIPWGL